MKVTGMRLVVEVAYEGDAAGERGEAVIQLDPVLWNMIPRPAQDVMLGNAMRTAIADLEGARGPIGG